VPPLLALQVAEIVARLLSARTDTDLTLADHEVKIGC
jgi:hypothetical protein